MEILGVVALKVMLHEFLGEADCTVGSLILMGEPTIIFVMTSLLAIRAGMVLVLADPMIGFLAGFVRSSSVL